MNIMISNQKLTRNFVAINFKFSIKHPWLIPTQFKIPNHYQRYNSSNLGWRTNLSSPDQRKTSSSSSSFYCFKVDSFWCIHNMILSWPDRMFNHISVFHFKLDTLTKSTDKTKQCNIQNSYHVHCIQ